MQSPPRREEVPLTRPRHPVPNRLPVPSVPAMPAEFSPNAQPPGPAPRKIANRVPRHLGRILAMQFLFSCDLTHDWTEDDTRLALFREYALTDEEQRLSRSEETLDYAREYALGLIRGVFREHARLDQLITDAAQNWSLGRMSCIDRNLMRIAVYELVCEMPADREITAAIIINEAIEISKVFGDNKSSRFINGVLDRIRRDLQNQPFTAAP